MRAGGVWLGAMLVLAALTFGACGVKAPPLSADALLPGRVVNLQYQFMDDGRLVLTFAPPTTTVKGAVLKDLGGFYVDRSENLVTPAFCPGCPVTYTERFDVPAVRPSKRRYVADTTYRFEDRLTPGFIYYYRIFAHDSDGEFHPGRFGTISVAYDTPSRPPDVIQTATEDRLVVLTWSPPDRLTDGRAATDLAGYHVYRRIGDGPWTRITSGRPWPGTTYEDTQVVNGRTYTYRVRSVRKWRETLIEGLPSLEASATPLDLTPPPPPVKVGAASVAKGVSLSWAEVTSADLAGYAVYRRDIEAVRFDRLGSGLISATTFLDVEVEPNRTYVYHVTAVDNSPAANESEPSPEVQIQYVPR